MQRGAAREIVRSFYREIFNREPDPGGAQTYENLIQRIGIESAVPKMLEAFMGSEEFRHRVLNWKVQETLTGAGMQLVAGQPVQHVISLGVNCLPCTMFKRFGIKRYSLPFDWLFSSPGMVSDCLRDDFSVFLDRQHYREVNDGQWPKADHVFYSGRYHLPPVFAHRNPVADQDYNYFVRCVERLRKILQNNDPKLFVLAGRREHHILDGVDLVLESLQKVTSCFQLICVEIDIPTNDVGSRALQLLMRGPNHEVYKFTPSSYSVEGNYFTENLDEWTLLRLVCNYRLALKDSAN